jgi:hypothetical protein
VIDERQVFERVMRGFVPPDDSFERMVNRRDRKRRNQRLAAGVVGISVFAVAVLGAISVASLDRSETSVVPGGSGTTGPTETGPTVTGPIVNGPYEYDPNADYVGLPPEGSQPTGPERSELVAEAHELDFGWVYVFEDGRVISWSATPGAGQPNGIREQRLTPEGVDLVRSGVIDPSDFICVAGTRPAPYACVGPRHEIPASAWEDPMLRPYVPYRYAICDSGALRLLPAAAQDLLRGKEQTFPINGAPHGTAGCFDVTTEEARALDQILTDAGLNREVLTFAPILPHGDPGSQGGG